MTTVISVCLKKKLSKSGEFLCSHFNIEDGRKYTFLAYYDLLFKKGKNATEIQKRCAVYGEGAMTDQMCPMWFVKFRAGDFSRGDAPRSGRPVEVDGDEIETLTENNQHHIMWEMANILKVSKSIKLLVKMKSVPFILWKKPMEFWGNPIYPCDGIFCHKK